MKKTLFRWLIALAIILPCMMLTAFAAERPVIASGYCGGEGDYTNLTWTLYEDGELVVAGKGAMASWLPVRWEKQKSSIRSVIVEDGVTTITPCAFESCENLSRVVIGDDVTEIGPAMFNMCSRLSHVELGSGVKEIESMALANCPSLTEITIPASVSNIASYAFGYNEALTTIEVEAKNKNYCVVNGVLFTRDMTTLVTHPAGLATKSYTIPDGVTTVLDGAFSLEFDLQDIFIPAATTDIGTDVFYGCPLKRIRLDADNTAFTLVDGVLYTADMKSLVVCPADGGNTTLCVPDGVETLYSGAVAYNKHLTSVCLPDSVTEIDSQVFSYATNLRSVVMGAEVTALYYSPFQGCTNLENVYYLGDETRWQTLRNNSEKNYSQDDPVFYANLYYTTRDRLRTLTAEEGVTLSAHCAPVGAKVSVVLQAPNGYEIASVLVDGVAVKGDWFTVSGHHRVEGVTYALHNESDVVASGACGADVEWFLYEDGELYICGVGAMDDYSIRKGDSNLAPWYPKRGAVTRITVAGGVTKVGTGAFRDCSKATEISLPKTVRKINGGMAYGCTGLTTVTIDERNPVLCVVDGVLFTKDLTQLALYPAGRTDTTYTVPDEVKFVWGTAFAYASKLEHVALSKNLAAISSYMFEYCTGLVDVTIPDSVTTIYNQAFHGCTGLTSVVIPKCVTTIGEQAFEDCENLTVYGWTGSEAETYAREGDIPFVAMSGSNCAVLTMLSGKRAHLVVCAEEDGNAAVAFYDATGRMTAVRLVDVQKGAQIYTLDGMPAGASAVNRKIILVNESCAPLCRAITP